MLLKTLTCDIIIIGWCNTEKDNSNNRVVFTDWYTVIISQGAKYFEIPIPKFLKELEKKLDSKEYNVFYNEKQKMFSITYDSVDYNVVLNKNEQGSLLSGEYSPLILKLLLLASKEKEYNDEAKIQAVRKAKIDAFIRSNYADMETLEDHELYLDYLKVSLKNTKNADEKVIINTKIANLVKIIEKLKKERKEQNENPLNLRLHINKMIFKILDDVDKLDEKDQIAISIKLKQIILDYEKIIDDYNKKKDMGLLLGNPLIPFDILERIIEIEFEIKTFQKNKKSSDESSSFFDDLERELKSIIDSDDRKGTK